MEDFIVFEALFHISPSQFNENFKRRKHLLLNRFLRISIQRISNYIVDYVLRIFFQLHNHIDFDLNIKLGEKFLFKLSTNQMKF